MNLQINIPAEDDPLADSARLLLKTLSVVVAGLCLYIRGLAGAYVLLFMFPLYIAICIFHCIQNFRALSQNEPLSRALIGESNWESAFLNTRQLSSRDPDGTSARSPTSRGITFHGWAMGTLYRATHSPRLLSVISCSQPIPPRVPR